MESNSTQLLRKATQLNSAPAIFFIVTHVSRAPYTQEMLKIKEEHKSFLTQNQEERFLKMGDAIPWWQLWATVADQGEDHDLGED